MALKKYFRNTISNDLLRLVTGKRLGRGIAREVYEYALDPALVIKFEQGRKSFQNVREWEAWQAWQHAPKIARWLAPCVEISPCGTVLVQKRTYPALPRHYLEKIPDFLTDRKRENYGLYEGRLVCHDYALMAVTASERMTKAKWW